MLPPDWTRPHYPREDSLAADLAEEARSCRRWPGYGVFGGTPPYRCDECGSGDPLYHVPGCILAAEEDDNGRH